MDSEPTSPRVLAGFVHIDEATVEDARQAITRQIGVAVELLEVARLPQWDAHRTLYRGLDSRSQEFDVLVKVDGDMIVRDSLLFAAVARMFRELPEVDQIGISVTDWFSGGPITGISFWRRGVRWIGDPDRIRSDVIRTSVKNSLRIHDHGLHLVDHGSRPTREQAVRYGAHRGMKARLALSKVRISDARAFVEYAGRAPHPRRLLAVAAAERGLEDPAAAEPLMMRQAPSDEIALLERRSQDVNLVPTALSLLDGLDRERRMRVEAERTPAPLVRRGSGAWNTLVRITRPLRGRPRKPNPEAERSPGAVHLRETLETLGELRFD